jgi:hypothetical protein
MTTKVSRRAVIKMMGAAGVALAAAPLLSKASGLTQRPGPQKAQSPASLASPRSSSEPLVLVVRGDEILGYRGLVKVPVSDASLAGMLHSRFSKEAGN